MRLRVFERLDVVVDLHRNDAGLIRDIAADHQHNAEFTNRVREAKHHRGQEPGFGERRGNVEESV